MDIGELPVVVQALMAASFLFGLLVGLAVGAGTVAYYAAREFSHRSGGECGIKDRMSVIFHDTKQNAEAETSERSEV